MANIKRKQPLLWGQSDLDDDWFQQPMLEQALAIAKKQELKSKLRGTPELVPKPRPSLETDPDLNGWFDA